MCVGDAKAAACGGALTLAFAARSTCLRLRTARTPCRHPPSTSPSARRTWHAGVKGAALRLQPVQLGQLVQKRAAQLQQRGRSGAELRGGGGGGGSAAKQLVRCPGKHVLHAPGVVLPQASAQVGHAQRRAVRSKEVAGAERGAAGALQQAFELHRGGRGGVAPPTLLLARRRRRVPRAACRRRAHGCVRLHRPVCTPKGGGCA